MKVFMALVLLMAFQASVRADVLISNNGERLVGKVIEETPDHVIFESELAGKLTIPRNRIRELQRTPAAPAASAATNLLTAPALVTTNPPAALQPEWFVLPKANDQMDWIQLKHGEWLRGRLKSMQSHKLEFDSEDFDNRTYDWEDIQRVWSPRFNKVAFGKAGSDAGSLFITKQEVRVIGAQTNIYPRSELMSIAPSGKREWDNWSGKITVGLTLTAGNSKQVDYNAAISLARRTPSTRLTFDYLGNVGQLDGVESINNHRFTSLFDYFLSSRLYVQIPNVEYYHDPLQNISYRVTIGAGVGYDLISNRRTTWNVTLGPAYQINQFSDNNGEAHKEAGAAVLSTRFDTKLSSRIDLILEYRGQLTSKEVGESTHHSVATLSVDLTRKLDLDISFVWDRISNPKPNDDLTTPKKDDYWLTLGVGLKF